MPNRFKIFVVIGLILGLCASGISYYYLKEMIHQKTETVTVIVPKRNIEVYSTIAAEDLTQIAVSPHLIDQYTVKNSTELTGKVALQTLYAQRLIDSRSIADQSENLGQKQVVGIYCNTAQTAGVSDGDTVDVYWSPTNQQNTQAVLLPSQRVALNARVLKVCDEYGNSIKEQTVIKQGIASVTKTPESKYLIYLLVQPEEVQYIISGSSNSSLTLVKKASPTIELSSNETGER